MTLAQYLESLARQRKMAKLEDLKKYIQPGQQDNISPQKLFELIKKPLAQLDDDDQLNHRPRRSLLVVDDTSDKYSFYWRRKYETALPKPFTVMDVQASPDEIARKRGTNLSDNYHATRKEFDEEIEKVWKFPWPATRRQLWREVPIQVENAVTHTVIAWEKRVARAVSDAFRLVICKINSKNERRLLSIKIAVKPGYPKLLQNLAIPGDFTDDDHDEIHRFSEDEDNTENRDPTTISKIEDPLGVYIYEIFGDGTSRLPNRGEIELYWRNIGLAAQSIGCSVTSLALVVLTHEICHAYSQLGSDTEGNIWHPDGFTRSTTEVKEFFAQYYCEKVLGQLNSEALKTMQELCKFQSTAYTNHQILRPSLESEGLRALLLELRRSHHDAHRNFLPALGKTQAPRL